MSAEPIKKRPNAYRTITLLPDGTQHSAKELAQMFGVIQCTISRRQTLYNKKKYTRDELQAWAAELKEKRAAVSMESATVCAPGVAGKMAVECEWNGPPRNIDEVDYTPSPAERAMLKF